MIQFQRDIAFIISYSSFKNVFNTIAHFISTQVIVDRLEKKGKKIILSSIKKSHITRSLLSQSTKLNLILVGLVVIVRQA